MTRKRKLLLYIGGVLMAACLAGWIVMLYAEKGRLQNAWEKEFLTRYRAVLNDLVNDLGHFEDAGSYEEQFSCLGAVTDDLMQMKAFMEVHANLMTVTMPENGSNERILIEDCIYGFCHGCLTCGSESVHNRNIILRRGRILDGMNLLWLKMRPDTPQHYEYITVEDMERAKKDGFAAGSIESTVMRDVEIGRE